MSETHNLSSPWITKGLKNHLKENENCTTKIKAQNKFFPNRIEIDKEEIFDQKIIARKFNEFFANIGPKNSNSKNTIWKPYTYNGLGFHGS